MRAAEESDVLICMQLDMYYNITSPYVRNGRAALHRRQMMCILYALYSLIDT